MNEVAAGAVVNPFVGLRPYEEREAYLFFGRDGQSDELTARLARKRFVAVVGVSGSGKSSLVRAGLFASLQGGFMPGTGGATVIGELKRQHPEIPIVAISGLFESGFGMSAEDVVALGAARALAKPFKRRDLLGIIAELLPGAP